MPNRIGLWLGKRPDSDEHIVLGNQVYYCRSCRRIPSRRNDEKGSLRDRARIAGGVA